MLRWRVHVHGTALAGLAGAAVLSVVLGRPVTASRQGPSTTAGSTEEALDALYDEGAEIYGTSCFECHMPGGVGRVLDGDAALANADTVIRQLLAGSANFTMPPFASLTDRQIAAVATFVRNAWENRYGVVLEADVRRVRAALKTD